MNRPYPFDNFPEKGSDWQEVLKHYDAMQKEHKHLLNLYIEAGNYAGMQSTDDFHSLPKLVEKLRVQHDRLMRLRPGVKP